MLSRTKYFLLEDGLYISIIAMLSALLIYNYSERLILEEELARVNNVKQVNYERKQEEHYKIVDQQQAKLERILKEIKSSK